MDKLRQSFNFKKTKEGGIKKILDVGHVFQFDEIYGGDGRDTSNYGLKMNVKSTGILEMDENVIHPFVRIHIVDLKKQKWLAKS